MYRIGGRSVGCGGMRVSLWLLLLGFYFFWEEEGRGRGREVAGEVVV